MSVVAVPMLPPSPSRDVIVANWPSPVPLGVRVGLIAAR